LVKEGNSRDDSNFYQRVLLLLQEETEEVCNFRNLNQSHSCEGRNLDRYQRMWS